MNDHPDSLALLRCIRNMLLGIGCMIFALGLFLFGYVLFDHRGGFVLLFWCCLVMFLLSAGYCWENRRPAGAGKDQNLTSDP